MGMKSETAVKVEHLTVNYEKTSVLWELSFEIPAGTLCAILGPNGAGKSTFLKSALGLLKPLSGRIEFFGKPLKEVRQKIAYVPQRSSVDWDFPVTVYDVVLMGRFGKMGLFKRPKAADREAARRVLEMVGLSAFAHRQISQLSGGQQQRLFIARALLQEADIYLMDEPFAGVDVSTEKALISLFDQLKLQGKTLILVHHDLSSVEDYFDWVVLLNTGLIASGKPSDVFNPETLMRTYGRSAHLLDEVSKLARDKNSGLI
jgi:manganese/zinc/iron transport system ATP- binding protein